MYRKTYIITEQDFKNLFDRTLNWVDHKKLVQKIAKRVSFLKHKSEHCLEITATKELVESWAGNRRYLTQDFTIDFVGKINIEYYDRNGNEAPNRIAKKKDLWSDEWLKEDKRRQSLINKEEEQDEKRINNLRKKVFNILKDSLDEDEYSDCLNSWYRLK